VSAEAKAELLALSLDMQTKFARIVRLVESDGLAKVHEPYIKHLDGKLWEMRLIGRDGIARAIYIAATGRRVLVLRTFVKKTDKTPRRELELALKRAREVV
jgi:phage-related protein